MRDGKSLAADLFLPEKPGRYPAVLVQTPYGKARSSPLGGPAGIRDRDHYAYVVVDWRGFHASRDAAVPRADRGKDGYDCVEWIAAQPWSDGKVGTYGGSALGMQQFETAVEHPPHLVCCVPMIAAMGQSYDRYYPGGVLLEAHVRSLERLGFPGMDVVRRFPDAAAPAWGIAERATYRPAEVKVPCLLITGWWDHYPEAILRTRRDLPDAKLLIGPWDHMGVDKPRQGARDFGGAAGAAADAARRFLDHHLRGVEGDGWKGAARVRYWTVGEEGWTDVEEWPGAATEAKAWKWSEEQAYAADPREPVPTLGGANLPPLPHGPTDHAELEKRKDLLRRTVPGPLRILGQAEVDVTFTADRPSCDVAAWLCDGTTHLADAVRRATPRAPGERCTATVHFPPIAATVKELRLYVASSNWPRYERNPHTGGLRWDDAAAQPLRITVHEIALRVPCRIER